MENQDKNMNAQISSVVAEWLDVSGANNCCMDAAVKPSWTILRHSAQETSS
tara:strand:- start:1449 stop:1601 length:153 start_codon:yes stop_codon:yes gene_type:complete